MEAKQGLLVGHFKESAELGRFLCRPGNQSLVTDLIIQLVAQLLTVLSFAHIALPPKSRRGHRVLGPRWKEVYHPFRLCFPVDDGETNIPPVADKMNKLRSRKKPMEQPDFPAVLGSLVTGQ